MGIEVYQSGDPNAVGDWVLAGDGVIGKVQCTKTRAQVLAAAPELLDALKYLLANAEANGWAAFMLSDARAAIFKAEGGE